MLFDSVCIYCVLSVVLGVVIGRLRLPILEKLLPELLKHENHKETPKDQGKKPVDESVSDTK